MNPYDKLNLRKYIESIPQEEVDRQTHLQDDRNKQVYNDFIAGLKEGKCFMCGAKIDSFVESKFCFHWFTYPQGIKKKYFEAHLDKPLGFFRLDAYFRWLANFEKPFFNVNDIKEEMSSRAYLETTYKYKNIEWAFSIGQSDVEGHDKSETGSKPHYHLQMKVDDRIFLKFNDFHIPFSDSDLFMISVLQQAGDIVGLGHSFGHGMQTFENLENVKVIDNLLKSSDTDDTQSVKFNRQTIVEMPDGEFISEDIINRAIEESKKTGRPVGKILQELLPNAKTTTILTPEEETVRMTKRSGKK